MTNLRPPLLFISGWGMSETIWKYQIEYFRQNYKTLAVSLEGDCMRAHTEHLLGIIKKSKLKNINLVGWSMGGMFAINFVSQYPEYVKKLVLVSAPAKFVASGDYDAGISHIVMQGFINKFRKSPVRMLGNFAGLILKNAEFNEEDLNLIKQSSNISDKNKALQDLLLLRDCDMRDKLRFIKIPTLIIHGKRDMVCPYACADYLHGKIKNSVLHAFENTGHIPFVTKHKEFNILLDGFFKDNEF
ncbi:alpha/beta hydrolase [bacterium]|nr:alpha/beta hydrolase [bacterium]